MPQEVNLEYEDAWQQMQIEIAGLSRKGRRVVANQAGHMIHHEQPELVVHESAPCSQFPRQHNALGYCLVDQHKG